MSRFLIKYILFVLGLTFTSLVKAQLPKQIIEAGDKLFEKGKYEPALEVYQKAMETDSNHKEVLYKYGRTLYKLNEFKQANRYLLKSSLLNGGNTFEDLNYILAESYRRTGKYPQSIRYYNYALRPYRKESKGYEFQRIRQSISSANWARNQNEVDEHYPILNFGKNINSKASDYAATIKAHKIYFTTLEKEDYHLEEKDKKQELYNKIFWVDLNNKKQKIELKFASKDTSYFQDKHLANLSFGIDNKVYFSVCQIDKQCAIWEGDLINNQIVNPVKLNNYINKENSNNTQPFFVTHNRQELLYFASDREGGQGGFDIWVSENSSTGYKKPINLGSKINTLGNEITPFYDKETQTLYFSSDWHEGFGGYDIFSAKGSFNSFDSIENLLQPINSYYNDYYFQTYEDSALFSSNRKEGNVVSDKNCCNDIFKLHFGKKDRDITQIESLEKDSSELLKSIKNIKVDVDVLNQYLPLSLYFHNDIPNPRSRDSTTSENYLLLADEYTSMYQEYILALEEKNDEKEKIRIFFEEQHKKGVESLKEFMPYLYKVLSEGEQITLTIKGFSSSLFESDYNYILAHRRIESLINYMKSYKDGVLLPYINQTASNNASLKFVKIPYGDFAIKDKGFSNQTMAIYSAKAAKQRMIEIIAVNKDELIEGELSFNAYSYEIGEIKQGEKLNRFFNLSNDSSNELKIYNISSNCDCVQLHYPSDIKGGEKDRIQVEVNTQNLKGKVNITLIVVTNSQPNLHELTLNLNVVP